MRVPRCIPSVTEYHGGIYVSGGLDKSGKPIVNIEGKSSSSAKFSSLLDMIDCRSGHKMLA